MLHIIETKEKLSTVAKAVPSSIHTELLSLVMRLDAEYGADRDPLDEGGYAVVITDVDDLAALRTIIDIDNHPCEWAHRTGKDKAYCYCLFLMNDDFSITVYMPVAIAPKTILDELED